MTPLQLVQYYINLLILQYLNLPKAQGTIQTSVSPAILPQTSVQQISFSAIPTSGSFTLSYNGNISPSIQWNDSTSTIQSDLQSIKGLNSVTVSGSIASQILTITFVSVIPPAALLLVNSNSLQSSGNSVNLTITETDVTLPIALQSAFNLMGTTLAQGVQLDILGKYVGVIRTGSGFNGQVITLDDTDFIIFIKMAITTNSSGSSLSDITNLIFGFFGTSILVFDYADMRMNYLISSQIGSQNLLELFVTENLLPKPMAVQLSIIVAPVIDAFFGFVTYDNPIQPPITRPFNNYDSYQTNWPWLTYNDAFIL